METSYNDSVNEPLAVNTKPRMKTMRDRPVRWLILILTCFFVISRYYNFDVPQGIQKALQEDLNLSSLQYNLLYTVYSVPNIVWPLFAGAAIDKIGCRLSVLIFGSFVLLGQSLFAVGCFIGNFPLLLAGRVVLGIGGEAIVTIKIPIIARWFRPHQQGLATGTVFAACRLGSIIQGSLTPLLLEKSGSIGWAGAAGAILSAISLTSGLIWIVIDKRAEQEDIRNGLPRESEINLASLRDSGAANIEPSKLKSISLLLVVMALNAGLICGTVYTFLGNGNKYLQERAGLSPESAGQYISILYIVSMFFSLGIGKLVDIVGMRAHGVTLASLITLLSFITFLVLPDCDGCWSYLYPMIALGVVIGMWSSCLFPAVALVSKPQLIGTSMGFVNIVINIFQAGYPLLSGSVQSSEQDREKGYYWPVIVYAVGALGAVIAGLLMTIFDKKKLLNTKKIAKKLPSIKITSDYKFDPNSPSQ